VAIIRLYIAWERSWVQYATTIKITKKLKLNKNKNKKTKSKTPKKKPQKPKKLKKLKKLGFFRFWGGFRFGVFDFVFWFLFLFSFSFLWFWLLLHIALNFSLKLCTTWWWPLGPKHVVVSYLPPYSYIIIINIVVFDFYPLFIHSIIDLMRIILRLDVPLCYRIMVM